MKKVISMLLSLLVMCVIPLIAFAGSIDVDLVYDDEALVFIGTVDEFAITYEENDYPYAEYSLSVTPNKKIKGDVEVDKPMNFEKVSTGGLKLQKNTNYLFGYLPQELYIWELESYIDLFDWEKDDYTKKSIILKERHNNTISGGMQRQLNDGSFTHAEEERQNLGKKIFFADFLGEDLDKADKIIFTFNDNTLDVDKDKFLELAKGIQMTNVKNGMVKDAGSGNEFENVLYIRVVNEDDTSYQHAYAAITQYGEVDRYGLFMSRMMNVDYEMKPEDIQKLYSLLPADIQDELPVLNVNADSGTGNTTNSSIILLGVIVLAIVIIIFTSLYVLKSKKKKDI